MKLYGLAEIAAALGVDRALVAKWRQRGQMPPPDDELAMGPVWKDSTIEPWIRERLAG